MLTSSGYSTMPSSSVPSEMQSSSSIADMVATTEVPNMNIRSGTIAPSHTDNGVLKLYQGQGEVPNGL